MMKCGDGLDFHREKKTVFFLALGFLQGVRGEFTHDVLETAVGHIFTSEDEKRRR
jgi:hypothetical protein